MTDETPTKKAKVDNPAAKFEKPIDIVRSPDLSHEEKVKALNTWAQDARQLLTASNEGMSGSQEGLAPEDTGQLDQIVRAMQSIGERPKQKASQ